MCYLFTSLQNYVPHAPSSLTCLTRLRVLRAFVPSCLRALRALLTHLARLICTSYNCFRWICSPTEIFNFPRTVKATTNRAVFICVKKQP